ncbi:STAS domain-containing protein [Streptacidiphilus monticola]|uniref:Anti-sigma factor antagonist n=1 Tax=Streptacidiphilus monticola TaxID=2161674 RepID=A0ABW1G8N0_9ACTN
MGQAETEPQHLDVWIEPDAATAGTEVLAVAGELDRDGLGAVREKIEEAWARRPQRLVFDLERLRFCDSSGLNLLLRVRSRAEQENVRLLLAAPGVAVRRLLELTGAETVFELYPTVADAVGAPADSGGPR